MKIAVYCEPLGVKTSGNPGRGMLKSLIQLRSDDDFLLVVRRDYERSKELVNFLADIADLPNWKLRVEERSRRISNLLALLRIKNYGILKVSADIYINTDCTALGTNNHPLVITVADLSVLKQRKVASYKSSISYFLRRFLIADGIKRADEIIAISDATKYDIISTFETLEEKIQVVYNGIGQQWFVPTAAQPNHPKIPTDYWIWWGHISSRKNLVNLIKGYHLASRKIGLPKLILIFGNTAFPGELMQLISELRLEDNIIPIRYMSTDELISAVTSSKGLLFPSFIEGFGLPVIEAMARGVPVLTSSVSSMPEIAGNEAILCDPYDVSDIASGLEKMLSPGSFSEVCIERRKKRANIFTYEKVANGYNNVIEKIFKHKQSGYQARKK